MKAIKFEYVFAIAILLVLSIALYVFRNDKDITTTLITSLVGAFSAISAFFFTKFNPSDKNTLATEPTAPKVIEPTGEVTEIR
jgi:hypothetical protein